MRFPGYVLVLSFILLSCSQESVEINSENGIRLYAQHDFAQVNKSIIGPGGEFIYVGAAEDGPAILVLSNDFSKQFYKVFKEYKVGAFNDVIIRKNGEYVLVGFTHSALKNATEDNPDFLIISLDNNGHFLWDHVKDFSLFNQWLTVMEDRDNNIVLGGETYSATTNGAYYGRIKVENGIIKDSLFDYYPRSSATMFTDVVQTRTGSYVYLGYHWGGSINALAYCTFFSEDSMKLQSVANFSQDPVPISPTENNLPSSIFNEEDGYLVASQFAEWPGKYAMLFTKIGEDGTGQWQKKFFGSGTTKIQSCVPFSEGYLLIGSTEETSIGFATASKLVYVVAVTKNGNMIWESSFGSKNQSQVAYTAVEKDGRIEVGATSFDFSSNPVFMKYVLDMDGQLMNQR